MAGKLSGLTGKISVLKDLDASKAKKIEDVQNIVANLRSENATIHEQMVEKTQSLSQLQGLLTQRELNLSETQQLLAQKTSALDQVQNQLKDLRLSFDGSKLELTDLKSQIGLKDTALKEKDSEITSKDAKLKEKDNQIQSLTKHLEGLKKGGIPGLGGAGSLLKK